ncbi:MAG: ribose-phosphate diphosphokinase [Nanoarchaeota archaeon]|nr:ribose-phosphate diphosphokinase [Nanoarchaeota archaeon]
MSDTNGILLVSGRSGEQMKNAVAEKLHEYFGYSNDISAGVNAEDFNNGEIFAQLAANTRSKEMHVFQSVYDPDTNGLVDKIRASDLDEETKKRLYWRILTLNRDVMELLILGDSIKRAGGRNIHVYLPYWAYGRQDKKDDGRVPISAKLMFDLIDRAYGKHLERICTVQIHAEQEQGFADLPVDNLPMEAPYALYILTHYNLDDIAIAGEEEKAADDVTIVSPDSGGDRRARKLARLLDVPFATIDKRRTSHGEVEASGVKGDVKGKKVIVYDDIGDSFGSLVTAHEILTEAGAQPEMVTLLTHGLSSASIDKKTGEVRFAEERIRGRGIQVVSTNSIPRTREYYEQNRDIFPDVIDLSYPLAQLVYCNNKGESLSGLIHELEEKIKAKNVRSSDVDKYLLRL